MAGQNAVIGGCADGDGALLRVDGKPRVDVAETNQIASGIGDTVERVPSANGVDPRRSCNEPARFVDRRRAMNAARQEGVIVGPIVLACHELRSPTPVAKAIRSRAWD